MGGLRAGVGSAERDTGAEGVFGGEDQAAFRHHVCLPGNARDHPTAGAGLVGQPIAAADHALLHDFIARGEALVRRQTGKPR